MIKNIEQLKIVKKEEKQLKDLSFDIIPSILTLLQVTDFSYVNKSFYELNSRNIKRQLFEITDFLKNKYLFFRQIILSLNSDEIKNGEEKIENSTKMFFLFFSNFFKKEFPKYFKGFSYKYSKNSFASEKIKEMVQIILDVNSIMIGIDFNEVFNHASFDKFLDLKLISDNFRYEMGKIGCLDCETNKIITTENIIFKKDLNIESLNKDVMIVSEIFKDIKIQKMKMLGFNFRFLFTLPFELEYFKSLKSLILHLVNIKFISVTLPQLKDFALTYSEICRIPFDINFCMPNLENLDLSNNKITDISYPKLKLKRLKKLNLSNNYFKEIPFWLIKLKCENVKINISYNKSFLIQVFT